MLEAFRTGKDVYRRQAGLIYRLDPEEAQRLPRDGRERQLGKIAVLGLGYQMGADKFISTCWKERILLSKPEAVHIVGSYRDGNPEIPQLWYDMEEAAFEAVRYPERVVSVAHGRISFARRGTWLYMRLPSGRLLSYAHPQIKKKRMPWLDQSTGLPAERWGVVYWGVDSLTHKWCEQNAYGGKWTENAVQALCRDLLALAMLRLEAAGYPQVLSVHDEAVSEHDQGFGSLEEFQRLLCVTPDWAEGLPIEAEVWRGTRYRK